MSGLLKDLLFTSFIVWSSFFISFNFFIASLSWIGFKFKLLILCTPPCTSLKFLLIWSPSCLVISPVCIFALTSWSKIFAEFLILVKLISVVVTLNPPFVVGLKASVIF